MSPLHPVTPPPDVDRAAVHALVAAFFDALGHFPDEPPDIEVLVQSLAPFAEIEEKGERYGVDAWVDRRATQFLHPSARHRGRFFEEEKRTLKVVARQVHVESVVVESVTHGETIERADTWRCSFVLVTTGGRTSIVRVRLESERRR